MPTYEYDCKKCGERVEFFQSMSEDPKRKCPECGAPEGLERRIGAGAGFIFRGSGFYITDYRSDSYKQAAKKDKDNSGSSSESSSTSKDSKKKSPKTDSSGSSGPAVKAAGS